jgi:hypothetical protein
MVFSSLKKYRQKALLNFKYIVILRTQYASWRRQSISGGDDRSVKGTSTERSRDRAPSDDDRWYCGPGKLAGTSSDIGFPGARNILQSAFHVFLEH